LCARHAPAGSGGDGGGRVGQAGAVAPAAADGAEEAEEAVALRGDRRLVLASAVEEEVRHRVHGHDDPPKAPAPASGTRRTPRPPGTSFPPRSREAAYAATARTRRAAGAAGARGSAVSDTREGRAAGLALIVLGGINAVLGLVLVLAGGDPGVRTGGGATVAAGAVLVGLGVAIRAGSRAAAVAALVLLAVLLLFQLYTLIAGADASALVRLAVTGLVLFLVVRAVRAEP